MVAIRTLHLWNSMCRCAQAVQVNTEGDRTSTRRLRGEDIELNENSSTSTHDARRLHCMNAHSPLPLPAAATVPAAAVAAVVTVIATAATPAAAAPAAATPAAATLPAAHLNTHTRAAAAAAVGGATAAHAPWEVGGWMRGWEGWGGGRLGRGCAPL